MSWTEALKEYAKQHGQFVVPKKDSEQYKAVKAIQEKLATKKAEPVPEVAPKKPRKVKPVAEGIIPPPVQETKPEVKPPRKSDPALQCAQMAVKSQPVAAPVAATPVKEKKPRKPRVTKTEIKQENVVMTF